MNEMGVWLYVHSGLKSVHIHREKSFIDKMTHPSVVMVTMVYQKEAGMLVNLLDEEPFSA